MTVATTTAASSIRATCIGQNPVKLWGLSNEERTRRIAVAAGHTWLGANADSAQMMANAAFAWDPTLYNHVAAYPGLVITKDSVPVVAHCTNEQEARAIAAAIASGEPVAEIQNLTIIAIESGWQIENKQLRKRISPFIERLVPENIRSLERASYFGAYKGVTDILTKYLWPEWALILTRVAAKINMSPNQVTAIGFILCLLSTYLMWFGHYWGAMATGLIFMVLDTVDGKLARCTITSSWWGNVFDHGIDLVHPPFWWWAWAVGLSAWGLAYDTQHFWVVQSVLFIGYVAQRLIEGWFIRRFGIHIHVWRKFDSDFRLITARRNPNMAILFFAMIFSRPDIGLNLVALWTLISLFVHLWRVIAAEIIFARERTLTSWLQD